MTVLTPTELTVPLPSGWTGIAGHQGEGRTTLLKVAAGELEQRIGFGEAGYMGSRSGR